MRNHILYCGLLVSDLQHKNFKVNDVFTDRKKAFGTQEYALGSLALTLSEETGDEHDASSVPNGTRGITNRDLNSRMCCKHSIQGNEN